MCVCVCVCVYVYSHFSSFNKKVALLYLALLSQGKKSIPLSYRAILKIHEIEYYIAEYLNVLI